MPDRKSSQLKTCLEEKVEAGLTGFENYDFFHNALPEADFAKIDTSTTFLNKKISAPILISPMTGGCRQGATVNKNLALTAQKLNLPMSVGSQKVALENPKLASHFRLRKFAPDIPLLANLGAVQLNYGFGIKECQYAVDMIGADALVFHLNPLQEVIQPQGDTNFANLLPKIKDICQKISVPVIVKEVGCGISKDVAGKLFNAGVEIVDVAGKGGTSWTKIAAHLTNSPLGEKFKDWGIPTAYSLTMCREIKGLTLISSGGIRNGIDIAKSIALGADLVGIAQPLLSPALSSPGAVGEFLTTLIQELKITMFCLGTLTIPQLKKSPITYRNTHKNTYSNTHQKISNP